MGKLSLPLWIESFVLVFQAGQYIPHESVIEYSCETGVREVQCLLGRLSPGHPSCSSSDIVKGPAGLLIKVAFCVLFLYKFRLSWDQGTRRLFLKLEGSLAAFICFLRFCRKIHLPIFWIIIFPNSLIKLLGGHAYWVSSGRR